jgi:hypothetical protein
LLVESTESFVTSVSHSISLTGEGVGTDGPSTRIFMSLSKHISHISFLE